MTEMKGGRGLGDRFREALLFASDRHQNHTRKGSEVPYLSHLLAVTSLVLEHGGDEDEAIAALLHDAFEDEKATLEEIRLHFGERVEAIVRGCSDTDVHPKRPWGERKTKFIARIAAADPSIRLVAAADKLHNARAILADYRQHGEELWGRFNAGKEEILWYYRSLVRELRRAGKTPLVDELDRAVSELERLISQRR